MRAQEIQSTFGNFIAADLSNSKNIRTSFKSMLSEELRAFETFADSWQAALEKYFGQSSQNYYHVMNASISQEVWTHNDFPYEKFLTDTIDKSVLTWQPTRANPPQLDEKLQADFALVKKVIENVDKIYNFHTQPPAFHMPGVKEYGTKIYGSVTILNAEGDVENCVVTSGGTIMAPDEETLRQIESERKRKLQRKEFNAELLEEIQVRRSINDKYNLNMV